MVGDSRRRFCGRCQLNVYNLSKMTRAEAENFLLASENRVCVRFYRRPDGTVLTQDCPVGWQALRRRVSRVGAAVFSMCVGVFTGLFAFYQSKPETDLPNSVRAIPLEAVAPPSLPEGSERNDDELWMGKPAIREAAIMGGLSMTAVNGMPANLDDVRTQIKTKRHRR